MIIKIKQNEWKTKQKDIKFSTEKNKKKQIANKIGFLWNFSKQKRAKIENETQTQRQKMKIKNMLEQLLAEFESDRSITCEIDVNRLAARPMRPANVDIGMRLGSRRTVFAD